MSINGCPCNNCGLNDEEWYCQLQCGVYQRWLESEDEDEDRIENDNQ